MSGQRTGRGGVHSDRDRGAATVFAAIVSMGLLAVLWFGVQLGAAVITRHRAEGAADLAALAAAAHAARGAEPACARARWVVEEMHAATVSCRLDGLDARVRVRLDVPGLLPGFGPVDARARAGPARP
ncbi:secretion/DNA translocation related TadE-like protein [Halopolyspora algeriensis]|uniref:Secretion/DNA translocation related TadE-like protein n=1 Tax=Halopolyspora algeriensis TaxID=1500506 RepID=A0A368VFX9_9ACTN|nr:Rv3654c family TadE-like protein [Halopolyspora algeriensis]RCW40196.1 secretion/DNA translocation related TadE-like protein [Halopolyspora algeriensis]TQM46322.1 secretion/DNA translocation related TadE-like protein [Halopolyspora algeriensis]